LTVDPRVARIDAVVARLAGRTRSTSATRAAVAVQRKQACVATGPAAATVSVVDAGHPGSAGPACSAIPQEQPT
jgi:hypothetical protein